MTLYISVFYYQYNEVRMRKIKLNFYNAIQRFNTSSLISTYKKVVTFTCKYYIVLYACIKYCCSIKTYFDVRSFCYT